MSFSDYAVNATGNTSLGGINIGEGCLAANMNNAVRQFAADARAFNDLLSPTLKGIMQVGDDVEPSLSGSQTLGTDAYGKSFRVTGTGDVVITLPTGGADFANQLLAFRVVDALAYKVTLSGSFNAGDTARRVIYAGDSILIQFSGSSFVVREYRSEPIGGFMLRTTANISLTDGVYADVPMQSAAGSFRPTSSFFDSGTGGIKIARRGRYRIKFAVHITPAAGCVGYATLCVDNESQNSSAITSMTFATDRANLQVELETSFNAAQTVMPRVKLVGAGGTVDVSVPAVLTIEEL